MAEVKYNELREGDKVVLTLKGTTIEGEVTDITERGNARVKIAGNKNSVVVTRRTNFTITREDPSAASVIDALPIGALFNYLNKFGKTKQWVKSGNDRYTKVEEGKPAVSFSKLGFPADASKVTVL